MIIRRPASCCRFCGCRAGCSEVRKLGRKRTARAIRTDSHEDSPRAPAARSASREDIAGGGGQGCGGYSGGIAAQQTVALWHAKGGPPVFPAGS